MYKKEYQASELAREMMVFLDCPSRCFGPMEDGSQLILAYKESLTESKKGGFFPVLVKVEEILWECLLMNSDEEQESGIPLKGIRAYRKKLTEQASLPMGEVLLARQIALRKQESMEDELDWKYDIIGQIGDGVEVNHFTSYWNCQTGMTDEVILAEIPVRNPWEIFAWLPMGGWNACPEPLEMMAVARYWFLEYGAVAAAITHDELEFRLDKPVPAKRAVILAEEQYGFCPDCIIRNVGSVGKLADTLARSRVWYFCWS